MGAEDLLRGVETAMSEANKEGRIAMKKPDDEIAEEAPPTCRADASLFRSMNCSRSTVDRLDDFIPKLLNRRLFRDDGRRAGSSHRLSRIVVRIDG